MKNRTRTVSIVIFLAVAAPFLYLGCSSYGHNHHRYYHSGYNDPYQVGYERGFEHGLDDRRAGFNFDYKHSEAFRRGISHDRYVNDRFRDGYSTGYKDAYYGRRSYYGHGHH